MHLELLHAFTTAAGAAGAAAAAFAGDSLIVKNGQINSAIRALAIWQQNQAAGFGQIATPSGHDQIRGERFSVGIGVPQPLIPLGAPFPFQPQELISATIAGSGTAGDIETMAMLMYYENLPGIAARLQRWDKIRDRITRQTTISSAVVGVTTGAYGTALALSAASTGNLLRANSNYAVLGMTTASECCTVWIQGPDTGGFRVGVPGAVSKPDVGSQFFPMLSRAYDLPCVPVISAGNKDSTFIGCVINENALSPVVTIHLGLIDGEI